jgi:hypothetical protein
MKKIILYLITGFVIQLLIIENFAEAADISIGATSWYTTWDSKTDADYEVNYDPDFLYGPVISAGLTPDVSLAFVFLYGQFDMTIEGDPGVIKLNRYDSDFTLNYKLGNWLKVFAGAKFIGFTWSDSGEHGALGPGAGFSAVIPVGGNFFLIGNISGLYLFGKEKSDASGNPTSKTREYGGNGSLSLSYYFPSASVTISLGGRCQYIYIDYEDPEFGDNANTFYGVTLSAIYSFSI